jgi:hypothetical protein
MHARTMALGVEGAGITLPDRGSMGFVISRA